MSTSQPAFLYGVTALVLLLVPGAAAARTPRTRRIHRPVPRRDNGGCASRCSSERWRFVRASSTTGSLLRRFVCRTGRRWGPAA